MMDHRPLSLLAVFVAALLPTMIGDGHPDAAPRPAALAAAQQASPVADVTCEGEPYIVILDPVGPSGQPADPLEPVDRAVQQAMFEAVNSRSNQLQNEERIVRAIAPVVWADDGTLTVDLRLIADSEATVEAILVTPAELRIVYAFFLDEGIGTSVPVTTTLPDAIIDNSGLDDAYVTMVDGQPVLRLVLTSESVATLESDVTAYGDGTFGIIIDRRLLKEWSVSAPVPTAVDVTIDEPVLTEAEADVLAVALRAGPLPAQEEPSAGIPATGPEPSPPAPVTEPEPSPSPNQVEVAFLPRPSEDRCVG